MGATMMTRVRQAVPVRARSEGRSLQGMVQGRRVLNLDLPTNVIGRNNPRSNFVVLPIQGRTEGAYQDFSTFSQFEIDNAGPNSYESDEDSEIQLSQSIRSKVKGKFLAMISASVVVAGTLPSGYTADKLEQLVFQRTKFYVKQGGKVQHQYVLNTLKAGDYNDRGGAELAIFPDPTNFADTVFSVIGAGFPLPATNSWTIDITVNHYWEDIPEDIYKALKDGGYEG